MGPPHLANHCYRFLGLRIAFARRTTPERKHTPFGFVPLQPGSSLQCFMANIIEAISAVANPYSTVAQVVLTCIRSQSAEHGTPPIRRRLSVERPPKRPFYMQSSFALQL